MHLSYRTIARSFSAELMDIFRIENSLTDLDQQVHDKLVYHLFTICHVSNHASNRVSSPFSIGNKPSTRTPKNSPLLKLAFAKWKTVFAAPQAVLSHDLRCLRRRPPIRLRHRLSSPAPSTPPRTTPRLAHDREQPALPSKLPLQATCPRPRVPVKVNTTSSPAMTCKTARADEYFLTFKDGDHE